MSKAKELKTKSKASTKRASSAAKAKDVTPVDARRSKAKPASETKGAGKGAGSRKTVAAKKAPATPLAEPKPKKTRTAGSKKTAISIKKTAPAKKVSTKPKSGAGGVVSTAKKSTSANGSKPAAKRTTAKKSAKRKANYLTLSLPRDYFPSDDEPFMIEEHKAYFRQKLLDWKEDIIRRTRETLEGLNTAEQHADVADRATSETDRALELRARDRQRKLVSKINAALARIDDGSYGYCEETGEPIGLRRLEARPIATLSLEAQERHERRERVFRED